MGRGRRNLETQALPIGAQVSSPSCFYCVSDFEKVLCWFFCGCLKLRESDLMVKNHKQGYKHLWTIFTSSVFLHCRGYSTNVCNPPHPVRSATTGRSTRAPSWPRGPALAPDTRYADDVTHRAGRFKQMYVVQLENISTIFHMLDRTTHDYTKATISPRMAAALEGSVQSDDEVEIDASTLSGARAAAPPAARSSLKAPKLWWVHLQLLCLLLITKTVSIITDVT